MIAGATVQIVRSCVGVCVGTGRNVPVAGGSRGVFVADLEVGVPAFSLGRVVDLDRGRVIVDRYHVEELVRMQGGPR